jgi:micrococcal nuclease
MRSIDGTLKWLLWWVFLPVLSCAPAAGVEGLAVVEEAIVFTGKVVAVKDGDTIEVLREGKAVRIRLEHIDCPETSQPFGKAAKQFTSDMAFGRMATVVAQPRPDRWGRLIATIHVDGSCLNKELVKAGLAWHFTRYSKDAEYAALERQAREAQVGVWASAGAVAPWDWRRDRSKRG